MGDSNNDFFRKSLPYLGPFLIFLGVFRLMVYYEAFGINIVSFLDFSEIITSFFDIGFVIILGWVGTFIPLFVLSGKKDKEEYSETFQRILNEPKFLKRLPLYFSLYSLLIAMMVSYLLMEYVASFFVEDARTGYLFTIGIYTYLFIFMVLLAEAEIKHKQLQSSDSRKHFISAVFLVVFSLSVIWIHAYAGIRSVKVFKRNVGVRIQLDDNLTIHSNANYYYIGKTNNFIFIYSEIRKETEVIPMSKVTGLTFPQKER